MKWGKRKASTPKDYGTVGKDYKIKSKDIRKEQRKLYKKYYKSAAGLTEEDRSKINKLSAEANRLAKKYDFDQDDGGGGSSAASRKAGARYMQIWDEIGEIENKRDVEASKKASDAILKKYGQSRIDKIKRQDVATGVAFAATLIAVPAATVTGLIVSDLRK